MSKSRTEIDKEIMYRKIMPSASKRDPRAAQADAENPGAGRSDAPPFDSVNGNESSMGIPALSAPSAAAMAKTLKRNPVTFPYKEENNMVLVNLMEELVINKLDSTLDRFNCCKCDKCKKDIAALALNRLKPRYVVMKEEEQEKRRKAELENGSEVTGALVQAILVVKKAPWH